MKRISLLFFLSLFINAYSQKTPSQAEMQKLLKENKALQEQMKNNPAFAEAMHKAMDQVQEEDGINSMAIKAPKKQMAKLASIPVKIPTQSELVTWSKKSYQSLYGKLSAIEKTKFNAVLENCSSTAKNLEDAAILNWIAKAPKTALLLAMKASIQDPDEPMFWNNLAAMLNLTGNEHKAIPALNYLLNRFPGHSLINNNLGQAYLGLGEINKAKEYLENCLQKNPYNPEANHSMGLIYRFLGNTAKSNYHFERETRVCYKKPVVDELQKSKSPEEVFKIARSKWLKPVNYFEKLGLNNFKVPKLPVDIAESATYYPAHVEFRKNLADEIKKWAEIDATLLKSQITVHQARGIYADLVENVFLPHLEKEKQEKIINWMDQTRSIDDIKFPTVGSIAGRSGQIRTRKFQEDMLKLQVSHIKEDSVNTARRLAEILAANGNQDAISLKWDKIDNEVDIKYCRQEMNLINIYLAANAANQPRGFEDHVTDIRELINEAMSYLSLVPEDAATAMQAHNLIEFYLTYLDAYSASTVIASTPKSGWNTGLQVNCDIEELLAQKYDLAITTPYDPQCAFKIVVPLVIAKVSFNCQKIEIEGGELLIANVEYEFKSGNTTMAIGPGFGAELGFVSVGTKHQAYVTFDRNGNYSDGGIKGEAGAELSGYLQEAGEEIENISFGPTLEAKLTYQVSLSSGASAQTEILGKSTPIEF